MNPQVPEYYRHLVKKPPQDAAPPRPVASSDPLPMLPYRADTFTLMHYDGWRDETVYTFAGPVVDGFQHVVTVNLDLHLSVEALRDYADFQVQQTESALKGCRLLKEDPVQLGNGLPAYRALFTWHPVEHVRLYREQVYVMHEHTGYVLSTALTKRSRRALGHAVERFMQSIQPVPKACAPGDGRPATGSFDAPPVGVHVRYEGRDGRPVAESYDAPFCIGRGAPCDVHLDEDAVEGVHARVVWEEGRWWILDAGSPRGLYVYGRPVDRIMLNKPTALWLGPGGPVVHLNVERRREGGPQAVHDTGDQGLPAAPAGASAPPRPSTVSPGDQLRYRADRFALVVPDGWTDRTTYLLTGPVTDGLRHHVTVHVDREARGATPADYAGGQRQALEAGLPGYRLLKADQGSLRSGPSFHRVIFSWSPDGQRRLYQEQFAVLHEHTGYILTAAFTGKTRKTLGLPVEHILSSFTPTVR